MTTVTINTTQELYVIPYKVDDEEGFSCYGFDNALDECERISLELVGRGVMPEREQTRLIELLRIERGTMTVWHGLMDLRAQVKEAAEADEEQCVFNLSPQLHGLEGKTVEVVDVPDAKPRRFIVGRSTGWAPVHLEVDPHESEPGSDPARREYHSVVEVP